MSPAFGRRINAWLSEPKGEQFRDNKWRFWFVALIGFSIVNAALTALVFNAGGVLQTYMGTVLVGVGALLAWLGVGALHYSDSTDPHLSRGVAILDSITLLFVVAHFSFLMWVYGHLSTLKNAEARAVQVGNEKIAEALARVAAEESKRARIENDTAYQQRKAAERGAQIRTGRAGSLAGNISTSPVELAKPPSPPADSSVAYLTRWDSTIRLSNFGELALAIFTLIFIRVRSSLTNAPSEEDFPHEIDAEAVREPRTSPRFSRTTNSDNERQSLISGDPGARKDARKILLEHLKAIAFHHPGRWFKADLVRGGVTIRMFKRDHGHEIAVAETTQSDKCELSVRWHDNGYRRTKSSRWITFLPIYWK